jgi:hypothetical protein
MMQVLLTGAFVALIGVAQAQVGGYGQCMMFLFYVSSIISSIDTNS